MAKPASDLEARVASLEKALSIVLVHLPAAFCIAQDTADAKTKKVLSDLEDRIAAGAVLARLELPESAHDAAFEEWDALPRDAKKLWQHANGKLRERFGWLGLIPAEKAKG